MANSVAGFVLMNITFSKRFIIGIASVLITVWSVITFVRYLFPSAPPLDRDVYAQLALVAAEKAAQLTDGRGSIVVWRVPNEQLKLQALQLIYREFDKQISQNKGLQVRAQETGAMDLETAATHGDSALRGEAFLTLFKTYGDVDVLVLLGVAPFLEEADYARLPQPRPKVLAVCLANSPSRQLFERTVLQAAILPRPQPQLADTKNLSVSERFKNKYFIVTPENLSALPR